MQANAPNHRFIPDLSTKAMCLLLAPWALARLLRPGVKRPGPFDQVRDQLTVAPVAIVGRRRVVDQGAG
ncbi:MAG: hypothetical protein JNK64_39045 [Myxococcales bacterium]|nr:hypothetical protein [Myxococcales bacterium]